jgi:hypothetical protein
VFEVAVCFCVNDPATGNCANTRSNWCENTSDVSDFAFFLGQPSRMQKREAHESMALCQLEKSIAGCVWDLWDETLQDPANGVPAKYDNPGKYGDMLSANNQCGGPACTAGSTAGVADVTASSEVMALNSDTNATMWSLVGGTTNLPPNNDDPGAKSPASNIARTVFVFGRRSGSTGLEGSALRQSTFTYASSSGSNDPRRQFVPATFDTPQVGVPSWATITKSCGDVARIKVPAGKSLSINMDSSKLAYSGTAGNIDIGGGDDLQLECVK